MTSVARAKSSARLIRSKSFSALKSPAARWRKLLAMLRLRPASVSSTAGSLNGQSQQMDEPGRILEKKASAIIAEIESWAGTQKMSDVAFGERYFVREVCALLHRPVVSGAHLCTTLCLHAQKEQQPPL